MSHGKDHRTFNNHHSSPKRPRRNFTPDQKATAVIRHLQDGISVSQICDELDIHPNQFYDWKKQALESMSEAFLRRSNSRETSRQKQEVEQLHAKLAKKDSVIAELLTEHIALKKSWGNLNNRWVEPDMRDQVLDFIDHWKEASELPEQWLLTRLALHRSRVYAWRDRAGQPNHHNGKIPRDHWLSTVEIELIVAYYVNHREDGYRRCCYKMIDRDIVCASPSTVYRVLKREGVMRSRGTVSSKKGKGFEQPLMAHEHWHTDISYIKIGDRFYFLICVLDGFSRKILHWDLRENMRDRDVGIVMEASREKYPDEHPRYITDNGKQFTGREFQRFIAVHGLTHVTTSPYYPQSNGKVERFHGTIKRECIRCKALSGLDHAKTVIADYIDYYNTERLHSAIGYVTPEDKLAGRSEIIQEERDQKLKQARIQRAKRNQERQKTAA